jgi:hypothetical protein
MDDRHGWDDKDRSGGGHLHDGDGIHGERPRDCSDAADPDAGRDQQGRFLPARSGNPATQWGPGNPPPRSPGRPKRSAWVKELESRLENGNVRQALADKLLKIALKGSDASALRAIQEIEDRTGQPIAARVNGLSDRELALTISGLLSRIVRRLPPEYHKQVQEAAYEALAGDESPWLVIEQEADDGEHSW